MKDKFKSADGRFLLLLLTPKGGGGTEVPGGEGRPTARPKLGTKC